MGYRDRSWTVAQLWELVENTFDALCGAYNTGKFVPLLEADASGYAYYAAVARFDGDASCVHLDTRLLGSRGNEKYDLVIGEYLETEERKHLLIEEAGTVCPLI